MKPEDFGKIEQEIAKLRVHEHELKTLDDFLANAGGTISVKINTRWILNLPVEAIKSHILKRKSDVENEIKNCKDELNKL